MAASWKCPSSTFPLLAPLNHAAFIPKQTPSRTSGETSRLKRQACRPWRTCSARATSRAITGDAPRRAIAFFDVDGTIVRSNVVSAYLTLKFSGKHPVERGLWFSLFLLQVPLFLLLDCIDRSIFNRFFYRNYQGLLVADKEAMGRKVHEEYVVPRIFPGALAHIHRLKERGVAIVLVTGSLDFLVSPLGELLGADAVFAARLKENGGRFTGELEGEAVSSREKAEIVGRYAAEQAVDLQDCHAYGDSFADLDMLQAVGFPHAVTPDARLLRIAQERAWPILWWSLAEAGPAVKPEDGCVELQVEAIQRSTDLGP